MTEAKENDYSYDPTQEEEQESAADFDVDDEYKPTPVIPNGNYLASITGAKVDGARLAIQITFAENGDEYVMSDGETKVDGAQETYNVWLPKAGDEKELTKSGKQTKRQWKINNMKKVGEKLGIQLQSLGQIREDADSGVWVGHEVVAVVGVREYKGEIQNEVTDLVERK